MSIIQLDSIVPVPFVFLYLAPSLTLRLEYLISLDISILSAIEARKGGGALIHLVGRYVRHDGPPLQRGFL